MTRQAASYEPRQAASHAAEQERRTTAVMEGDRLDEHQCLLLRGFQKKYQGPGCGISLGLHLRMVIRKLRSFWAGKVRIHESFLHSAARANLLFWNPGYKVPYKATPLSSGRSICTTNITKKTGFEKVY